MSILQVTTQRHKVTATAANSTP